MPQRATTLTKILDDSARAEILIYTFARCCGRWFGRALALLSRCAIDVRVRP